MSAPTPEQQRVAAHRPVPGQTVVINAYAGCGKSTVLKLLSEANLERKITYICFNAANAAEARRKFPKHVDCRTTHSLARRVIEPRYPAGKIGNNLRPREVADLLSVSQTDGSVIRDTLNNFLCSSDEEILPRHVRASGMDQEIIVHNAKKLWTMMKDPKSDVPLSHDGYLKIFCLECPDLDADVILLDEAQDTNPVVADYLLAQRARGCAVVLVGDTHQSIYGFRGAMNSMEKFLKEDKSSVRFELTTSFRLTPQVAEIASKLLNRQGGSSVHCWRKAPAGEPCGLACSAFAHECRTHSASPSGNVAPQRRDGAALVWDGEKQWRSVERLRIW